MRPYYSALVEDDPIAQPPETPRRRLGASTAIFAIATGFSRVAGLAREVVAASLFGTRGPASAFTIASQIPNLMSNLFAQAALSAAFVPVFTDLLQQGKKREAFRLASTLFWIILIALGALTAIGILGAGVIMPLFTGSTFNGSLNALTAGLAQVLFPVVLLLGLTGLLVGILQSYDEFSIPAIAPAVWNLVILVLLVALQGQYHGGHRLYAYAIAWLVATVVQGLMVASALRRIDFRLQFSIDWHDPRIRQVFTLMLPVTIGLGIVNLDQLLNSVFGTLVSTQAPRAIDNAFRIYMLPQGIFSVAVATVLFPTLSRQAARRDVGRDAPRRRQRTAPDQPAADPLGGGADGARDSDHAARVPARQLQRPFDPPGVGRAVLVCLQPSLRRPQPAPHPDVLRRSAAVDPDRAGRDEHDRRRDRQRRPVQAAGDRRAGDRHRGGQRGDARRR